MQKPEQFYDSLSSEYDEMTGMKSRFLRERHVFQSIIRTFKIKSALDAGSGTGVHSILLAQLGLSVTAVDISEKMLRFTHKNAKQKRIHVKTVRTSFPNIKNKVNDRFDSVFCLGNSLPHILEEKELNKSLRAFRGVLKKDGWIFIQILNYDRVMKNRERIQNIKEINGKLFIRFYDYTGKTVLFNILTIEKQKNKLLHSIRSVEIRPWKHTELVRSMECAGYRNIKLFGSLTMDAYLNSLSKDLVIVAQQSN